MSIRNFLLTLLILPGIQSIHAQNPQWVTKSFSNYSAGVNSPGQSAQKIVAGASGDSYAFGRVMASGAVYGNYALAHYDVSGKLINSVTGALDNMQSAIQDNSPIDMISDASGNLYIAATEQFHETDTVKSKVLLAKYDASLNLIWSTYITNPITWYTRSFSNHLVADPSGNIYLAAEADNTVDGMSFYFQKVLVASYTPDGNNIYTFVYDNPLHPFLVSTNLAVDSKSNVFVTGGFGDGFILKVTRNGTFGWFSLFDPSLDQYTAGGGIAVDQRGKVYADYTNGASVTLVKYDESGNELWEQTTSAQSLPDVIAVDELVYNPSGSIYEVCLAINEIVPSSGLLISKFDAHNGARSWQLNYEVQKEKQGSSLYASSAALGSDNGLVIAGVSGDSSMLLSFSSNGHLQKQLFYNNGASHYETINSSVYNKAANSWLLAGNDQYTENGNFSYSWLLMSYSLNGQREEAGAATRSLGFAIFPNPSKGDFNIEIPATSANLMVRIYNVTDATIYEEELKNVSSGFIQPIQLNASPGVYYMKISDGIHESVQKLVIQ